jgi:predicted nucleotidyltransferase
MPEKTPHKVDAAERHFAEPAEAQACPSTIAARLALSASDMLAALGISVRIVGSLAKSRYVEGSDIDFLVESYPRHLKYAIEGRVEDCLGGHPFDVIYLDEIPPAKRGRFVEGAVDARHLR